MGKQMPLNVKPVFWAYGYPQRLKAVVGILYRAFKDFVKNKDVPSIDGEFAMLNDKEIIFNGEMNSEKLQSTQKWAKNADKKV